MITLISNPFTHIYLIALRRVTAGGITGFERDLKINTAYSGAFLTTAGSKKAAQFLNVCRTFKINWNPLLKIRVTRTDIASVLFIVFFTVCRG